MKQQQAYKEVEKSLENRLNQGETGKKIKIIKGAPVIVKDKTSWRILLVLMTHPFFPKCQMTKYKIYTI